MAEMDKAEKQRRKRAKDALADIASLFTAKAATEKESISSYGMEKIGPGKAVRWPNGETYILGNGKITKYDVEDGKPHHFMVAIACGKEMNIDDCMYTILEMWEDINPETGEAGVAMCENYDITIAEELLGLSSENENTYTVTGTNPVELQE